MDLKYKTYFQTVARAIVEDEEKQEFLSTASLNNLKGVFGGEIPNSVDLLPLVGNLCNPGLCNLNDDCLSKEDGLLLYSEFEKKFIDIEHRRDRVYGYIIKSGLSKFKENTMLNESEAEKEDCFNIAIGALLWKVLNKKLAGYIIEASDPSSDKFGEVSLSFEIGFSDYKIAVGSKVLSQAKVLNNQEDIEKYDKLLRCNGGRGFDENGNKVYRVIAGDIVPLGAGLVADPAAEVSGIFNPKSENKSIAQKVMDVLKREVVKDSQIQNITVNIDKKNESKEEIVSDHKQKQNKDKIMELKNIKDLNDDILKEVAASSILNLYNDEIRKLNEKWLKEREELEIAKTKTSEQNDALATQVEDMQKQLNEAKENLEKLQNEINAQKENELFNQRMTGIDTEYILDDEDRKVIANKIKGMDEESYNAYTEEFKILMRDKKREIVEARQKEQEEQEKELQETVASQDTEVKEVKEEVKVEETKAEKVEEVVGEVIDNSKAETTAIPNSTQPEQTLLEKYADAFSVDSCLVRGKKMRSY